MHIFTIIIIIIIIIIILTSSFAPGGVYEEEEASAPRLAVNSWRADKLYNCRRSSPRSLSSQ